MKLFLFSLILLISQQLSAQQIKGKVVSDSVAINQVLIININSQEKTYSDFYGGFSINANMGDELRIVKEGYERKILTVRNYNELLINLNKIAIEID